LEKGEDSFTLTSAVCFIISTVSTGVEWSTVSRCSVRWESPSGLHSYSREPHRKCTSQTFGARSFLRLELGLVSIPIHAFSIHFDLAACTLPSYIGVGRSSTIATHSNLKRKNPPIQVHSPLSELGVSRGPPFKPPPLPRSHLLPRRPRMDGPSEAVTNCMEYMVESRLEAPFVAFQPGVLRRLICCSFVWCVSTPSQDQPVRLGRRLDSPGRSVWARASTSLCRPNGITPLSPITLLGRLRFYSVSVK
jgi:hypothetical protein